MRLWLLASLALLVAPTARADPYVFESLGFNLWHLAAPESAVLPRATTSVPTASDVDRIATIDERIGVGVPDVVYTALDVEIGAFAAQPRAAEVTLALASVGTQRWLGPVNIGGELAGGIAVSPVFGGIREQLPLDARGRIDVAITDTVSIGGVFGISLVGDGWMAGIALGGHAAHR
jgi:hypothetical protein